MRLILNAAFLLVSAFILSVPITRMSLAQGGDAALSAPLKGGLAFFTAFQDIPLMEGLEELPDQIVSFDKPGGRIVESVASMDGIALVHVEAYYKEVLPSFGWVEIEANLYSRNGERLSLSFERVERHQFVRFMVAPK